MLKATIVVDNIAEAPFVDEWGFCAYIRYNGKTYLLDTGASSLWLKHCDQLGLSPIDVDYAVLSHAHDDHSGGFDTFFKVNRRAALYVSEDCHEDCYIKEGIFSKRYIGIPKGVMAANSERIIHANGFTALEPGVWLVPHLPNHLEDIGRRNRMYRLVNGKFVPDDFAHEQSLVFDTDKGLVVFNSCSHSGLQNIIRDLECYLPGKKVHMTVGGLHLYEMSDDQVRDIARMISNLGIEYVVTGHCTGERGFEILHQELGRKVQQTRVGLTFEV